MTWIFLSPAPVRTTSNSVFSSSPPPASPPPPAAGAAATATGAAAVTPKRSSNVLQQLAQLQHRQLCDAVEDLVLGQGPCHLVAFLSLLSISVVVRSDGSAIRRRRPRGPRPRRRPALRTLRPRRCRLGCRRLRRSVGLGLGGRCLGLGGHVGRGGVRYGHVGRGQSRLAGRPRRLAPRGHRPSPRAGRTGRRRSCGAGPGAGRPAGPAAPGAPRRTGPGARRATAGRPALRARPDERTSPSMRPPLTIRWGLARENSRRALATALTSPSTNVMAVGPVSRSSSGLVRAAGDGQPDEGVLEDLVVAAGGSEVPPQLGQVGDGEAAVLGDDRRGGALEALTHLVDHGDLVGSRVVHRSSAANGPWTFACDRTRGSKVASSGGPTGSPLRTSGAPEVYGVGFSARPPSVESC